MAISRRIVIAAPPLLLAGCVAQRPPILNSLSNLVDPSYTTMYAAITTEPFPVPAIDLSEVDPQYLRREVAFTTPQPPGTIVVDPYARFAYFVLEKGRAIRYGVGVGKTEAFNFKGDAVIARKAEWPRWTPTPNMIAREPERYGKYAAGLPGGPENPLGPRALYLYKDGRDTLYRLHGTTEPWSIGKMVSSGCIRLLNQDIIDLYRRVAIPTKAVVLSAAASVSA
ncbi:hypothetical protein X566_23780 [Afipia sp. P52-10]|jgi:lipoprotein-anchoring transpeptidase ErfK/SrfK|uniref:L,D-transpeptidase n=1 Tax=Afipia sp. P52-10 TaxID=1429916 RepID=UPI0003DF3482|nr:L,D-transpeptidase [Afipia sp. P52-10]ETR75700.1 hypothetical protein X566_23780 [Afipia sp. P52-10]